MKIGIIGQGKVGVSFEKLLKEEGFFVVTASREPSEKISLTRGCDVIFVTTPDDEIKNVWNEISPFASNKLICHMSGALASDVFSGAARRASLHPMMAVSGKNSQEKLRRAFYTVEGTGAEEIMSLFPMLEIKKTESGKKTLYHAAAVMASNLVVSLIDISCDMLTECGFTKDEALKATEAMVKENVNAVYEKGVSGALTGPLERGDAGTIARHLDVLSGGAGEAYRVLSKHLIKTAKEKNPKRDYGAVEDILKGQCLK